MKPDIIKNISAALRLRERVNSVSAVLPRRIARSFRAKVMALVSLSVLVPSGLIWIFTVENTERFQTERTRDRFGEVMNDAVREIGLWYRERMTDTDRLLASPAFRGPLADLTRSTRDDAEFAAYQREVENYLTIVGERFPVYRGFVVVDPRGVTIWSSDGSDHDNIVKAHEGSMAGGASLISPALFQPDEASASQWLVAPIDVGGNAPALVFARLDLGVLGRQLASTDGVLDKYVATSDGTLVTLPRYAENRAGKARVGSRLDYLPAATSEQRLDRYDRDLTLGPNERSRVAFMGLRSPVPGQDLWVVCEAQESRFIAPTLTRKNRMLVANSLICVLFVLAGWRLSQYLLEPLQQLRLGAQKINEGMAGVQIQPAGNDEITDMIHAFNEMAQKISVTQAQLNAQNKILENKNSQLTETNDTLERLSVTDGLTGLFNHRHFWTLVDQEVERGDTKGKLALVLLDIDDFKQVNDRFGHEVGDILIAKVAEVLGMTVRAADSISRYGGEEFAVLLPRTDLDGAMRLSEKIRLAVEALRVIVPNTGVTLNVTISVGVSFYMGDKREFFNAADRALYTSKASGKNRVHLEAAEA